VLAVIRETTGIKRPPDPVLVSNERLPRERVSMSIEHQTEHRPSRPPAAPGGSDDPALQAPTYAPGEVIGMGYFADELDPRGAVSSASVRYRAERPSAQAPQ
jgi:hypothetical protein